MSLNFSNISLDQQDRYRKYFAACSQKSSDYSFINLWGWAEEYGLYWAWTDDLIWIKQTIPDEFYWAPVGNWEKTDWKKCFDKNFKGQTTFIRIPQILEKQLKDSLDQSIIIEETRNHWDYLYSLSELIELEGKPFHKKKNLLNQFKKKYDYEYLPFEEKIIDKAMAMQENWCTWRDCESYKSLSAENRVISKILNAWNQLKGLTGGAILSDGKMVAYTIGEALDKDTLLIHFEKADSAYKGIYQAINQIFLENSKNTFKTVNREQDLGDEGLRKAKLSYRPMDFLKKYMINLT